MAKFEEAYFKIEDKSLSIEKYLDKIHYGKLYCPECFTAPLHIVRKQETAPYYASNSKQEHLEDCQHYEDFIANKRLNKFIDSKEVEDRERLDFLIKNNLQGAINLLIKKEIMQKESLIKNDKNRDLKTALITPSSKYKRESIPRVNIKRLFSKKEEYLDNYIIIWGSADIQSKIVNSKFKSTMLIFRVKEKFRFSIKLTETQINFYKELPNNPMNKGFAVFGLLRENNNFLELKLLTTKHLQYL